MTRRVLHTVRSLRFESLEPRQLLAVAGTLDPTFSGDGKATISVADIVATDVALQADGKTVVVGSFKTPVVNYDQFLTARFNVDGTLDTGFGVGGLVKTQLSDIGSSRATAVAIQPDGKIVVVGTAIVSGGLDEQELAAARYNTDGSVDNTFDDNGVLSRDMSGLGTDTQVSDVVIQPDGKIVIVGTASPGNFFLQTDFYAAYFSIFGAFRGLTRIGFGDSEIAEGAALDNLGRVFITGQAIDVSEGTTSIALTRLTTFELPPELGGPGTAGSIDFETVSALPGFTNVRAQALFVRPTDGKIVVAGTVGENGQRDFFVTRFTADGLLDPTFGETQQGFTITDLGGDDVVAGICPTPSGGGGGFIVSGGSSGMAVVKYNDNGLPDTSFSGDGELRLGFGGDASIAPGPGRRITLAGGGGFPTRGVLLNGAREVNAFTIDNFAIEGTANTGRFFVGRTENLPFPTRVFFSVTGTATPPSQTVSRTTGTRDYNMNGLVIPSVGAPYVDIPAGQTNVQLTFTPFNDTTRESTETATFTMLANSIYEISSPSSGTITLQDDDTANISMGVGTATLPNTKQVGIGQEVKVAATWTVPTGGWRDLSSIELRLRNFHDGDALAILKFDEATNSFSVESTPGAGNNPVSLVLSKCTFQAAGPTAPTVTILFTFVFNAPATNERFLVDIGATDDAGVFSGFAQFGELHVHKKPKGNALALLL